MMQLSAHFSLEELTRSETAIRKGLDNTPDAEIVENLKQLALGLEKVRTLLGYPMHISSGYRSPKVNSATGGSSKSAHMEGYAADFVCPSYGSVKEICCAIRDSEIEFDQLIYEGGWAHISFAPAMRNSVITAHFNAGRVSYTQGIS